MYNTDIPLRAELPTTKQLLRSTLIAALVAVTVLITVVLPAEYGVDPTGIGRALRLTQMGEIKTRLAAEAAADAVKANAGNGGASVAAAPNPAIVQADPPPGAGKGVKGAADLPPVAPEAVGGWRDEIQLTLKPGQGAEVKLAMKEGEKAQFSWTVAGGVVNHDTHGDGGGRSLSYNKGRGVGSDQGELTAAFLGSHGWFWRNRSDVDVKVTLRTRGQYADIKRVM